MANTASAIKRVRSNERKRLHNRNRRAATRTQLAAARSAILLKQDDANAKALAALSALDKAAQKGVIHKKNAARRKSRLMKKMAAVQSKKK